MSDKVSTLEALRLTATAAKGYVAQQIANTLNALQTVLEEMSGSLETLETNLGGKTAGGASLAAEPNQDTLATEKAVQAYVDSSHSVISLVLPASSWVIASDGSYTQTFSNAAITAEHRLEIAMDTASIQSLIADSISSIRVDNDNGTPTVVVTGGKPSSDLSVQITLVKVMIT